MGIRGEVFSTKLLLQNRTYFFNVKENRLGDLYLNIVESKNRDTGGFDRQSVIVFADDLSSFLGEFEKALKVMEKAVRGQKRGGKDGYDGGRSRQDGETSSRTYREDRTRRESGSSRDGEKRRAAHHDGGRGKHEGGKHESREKGKRVVVKKRD